MSYDVVSDAVTPQVSIENWIRSYRDRHLEMSHDQSMLSLVTPDDSLIVAGPPRLSGDTAFYVVGMVNSLQYSESRQVQPMKAIGSSRHIFASTNAPVQGSIARLMFHGPNLARALYGVMDLSGIETIKDNDTFSVGEDEMDSTFFTNLADDLYRLPIGLGIIYRTPSHDLSNDSESVGAEYLEGFTVVNKQVSMQSGQAMVMESVSFMADRVVPWNSYASNLTFGELNPASTIMDS